MKKINEEEGVAELSKGNAQKKIEAAIATGKKPEGVGYGFMTALAGLLPTVVGAVFAGDTGAAVGADAGIKAMGFMSDQEIANRKLAQDQRNVELAQIGSAIKQDESLNNPLNSQRLNLNMANLEQRKREFGLDQERLGFAKEQESRRLHGQEFSEGEKGASRMERAAKAFNTDILARDAQKALIGATKAKEMLNRNNPIDAQAVKRLLARAAGEVGAMTDKDVEDFAGSKDFRARFGAIYEQAVTGKLTPQNREYMLQLVDTFEKVESKNLNERRALHVGQYGEITGNREKVENVISGGKTDKAARLRSLLK